MACSTCSQPSQPMTLELVLSRLRLLFEHMGKHSCRLMHWSIFLRLHAPGWSRGQYPSLHLCAQQIVSFSSMAKLKSMLNCPRVIGCGQRSGFSHDGTTMGTGLQVGRSILWNPVATAQRTHQVAGTNTAQLFIGVLIGARTVLARRIRSTVLPVIYQITSMFTASSGTRLTSERI